jgi:hypothetical protein
MMSDMKCNSQLENPGQQVIYEIRIQGWISERWMNWFQGQVLRFDEDVTILTIPVADQSALRGILNKIWDLNLTLVSAIWLEKNEQLERSQNE